VVRTVSLEWSRRRIQASLLSSSRARARRSSTSRGASIEATQSSQYRPPSRSSSLLHASSLTEPRAGDKEGLRTVSLPFFLSRPPDDMDLASDLPTSKSLQMR
jgi:hypothetical protein